MTPDHAAAALRAAGLEARDVEPIGDGWSSWTFEVDGEWIARFPRNDGVAARLERENRLLPQLARTVSFGVPDPVITGQHNGRAFHAYRKLAGEPLTAETTDAAALASVLRELHAFPADLARDLLGPPGVATIIEGDNPEQWRQAYRSLWSTQIEPRVLPVLSSALATQVADEYDLFLAGRMGFTPALIHNDLGTEHILVDRHGALSLIDFEYSAVGDPAYDFIGLWNELGLGRMREVLALCHEVFDDELPGRVRFYRWMGSVWAILHGLDTDDEDLVADATATTEERIANRRRVCAAIIRDDQILMVHFQGRFWTLPGGGVEDGETDEQALLRELMEEAGMRGRNPRLLYRTTYGLGTETCFVVESDDEPVTTDDVDTAAASWHPIRELEEDSQVRRVLAALGEGPKRAR